MIGKNILPISVLSQFLPKSKNLRQNLLTCPLVRGFAALHPGLRDHAPPELELLAKIVLYLIN
jgi:hypothetical protein